LHQAWRGRFSSFDPPQNADPCQAQTGHYKAAGAAVNHSMFMRCAAHLRRVAARSCTPERQDAGSPGDCGGWGLCTARLEKGARHGGQTLHVEMLCFAPPALGSWQLHTGTPGHRKSWGLGSRAVRLKKGCSDGSCTLHMYALRAARLRRMAAGSSTPECQDAGSPGGQGLCTRPHRTCRPVQFLLRKQPANKHLNQGPQGTGLMAKVWLKHISPPPGWKRRGRQDASASGAGTATRQKCPPVRA
jgi:hypothetical protein